MVKPLQFLVASTRSRTSMVVLGVMLALASVAGVMAQALGPAGPSPATGAASVIAQGVYDVTDNDYVWQVSTYTAEAGAEPMTVAAPIFVLPRATPLLVTDQDSGIRQRVANGEAVYLSPGQRVQLETFGPPDDFIFVELTPDNAASTGADPLVGQAFRPLAGSRDIDLVRDVLDEGEQSELPGGAGRTLVFGLTGQVSATTTDGAEMPIAAGDIAEFEGPITFTGVIDGSEFVAAYIGSVIGFGDEAVGDSGATPATAGSASPAASPEVTAETTFAPTQVPTEAQTQEPTVVPTENPTEAPTQIPTVAPTQALTEVSTVAPTVAPTETPAENPPGTPAEVIVVSSDRGAGEPPFDLEVIEGDPGTDTDGDGLTDLQEEFYATDPEVADSDGDTIDDVAELVRYGTDPLLPDTDDDGINDSNEIFIYESDPLNLDTDGDILYDGGELVYDTDVLNPDSDGDGLTDGEEVYFVETEPDEADTDGDGINDFDEVVNGTDPLGPNSSGGATTLSTSNPARRGDSDRDGLTNAQETRYGTDPGNGDTDGDSVNDSNEIAAGTDPLDIDSWPR